MRLTTVSYSLSASIGPATFGALDRDWSVPIPDGSSSYSFDAEQLLPRRFYAWPGQIGDDPASDVADPGGLLSHSTQEVERTARGLNELEPATVGDRAIEHCVDRRSAELQDAAAEVASDEGLSIEQDGLFDE